MSGSPQASYPQTYSFTLKHQEIRTFWNLNMRGIGGEEGTEEESSPGQAGGKLKMAACPSWVAEVGAAGALADPGGLKSGSVLPSQTGILGRYSRKLRPQRLKFHSDPGEPESGESPWSPPINPKDSHKDFRGSWQLLHFQLPDPAHFPLSANSNLGPSRGKRLQPSLTPLQMETCAPGCEHFRGCHTGHTLRCLDSFAKCYIREAHPCCCVWQDLCIFIFP
ncbi:uncharacterized protein LOC129015331 isoform X1 [Pongo pygmaeus]|nr:uncharacterized protein LOC129015331 isoform X1 [Pongo pygmaeus]XP_054309049.1 uncharacterized protein LOC129015331 isoform X1 [Pongo pygmaeus]XP_054309050.1 uncharacterized protein LOC129015331 isoform X1 [Pongo pygmaeus]XP_054309051.1 uncharacterized protein LOC129015331 isoform X1 [Pongo pygmaeus]XP_054309052.1 uncharacterized protein LOC129015331 isoform X1 [Pongo pygmaeus]XP_054309053.1 uncharacterized protein LOC129015331 isoform X1 [Pongo pygmaeus]XP_054390219.1 uncharacterized prot